MAQIIDGLAIATRLREQLQERVANCKRQTDVAPGLATVLVGEDSASQVYVRNKIKACQKVGMESCHILLPATISEAELIRQVQILNADPKVHGILVQLPLPKTICSEHVINAIDPRKDVDCFHPANLGCLLRGEKGLRPCTPAGILALLDAIGCDPAGKDVVVLGRSNIVGKPVALMLLERHATVTICHSRTVDLIAKVRAADIVIAAIGRAGFVKGDWIKPGAVVIDVGINRLADGKLMGDVDFVGASRYASFITPVPGGVGPMTIAMLLQNTLDACEMFATRQG